MRRDDEDDWDDPEPDDFDDDVLEMLHCPECGEDIYEDSEQCPHCGMYVKPGGSTSALSGKPWWFVLLAILGIVAVIGLCIF